MRRSQNVQSSFIPFWTKNMFNVFLTKPMTHLKSFTTLYRGSISPTFYEQLLRSQIPKVKKDIDNLTVFLNFWDLRT